MLTRQSDSTCQVRLAYLVRQCGVIGNIRSYGVTSSGQGPLLIGRRRKGFPFLALQSHGYAARCIRKLIVSQGEPGARRCQTWTATRGIATRHFTRNGGSKSSLNLLSINAEGKTAKVVREKLTFVQKPFFFFLAVTVVPTVRGIIELLVLSL